MNLPTLRIVVYTFLLFAAFSVYASDRVEKAESILIHPPYSANYVCGEHWAGQFKFLGDALGADCTIGKLVEEDGRKWVRRYSGDGRNNEDWYGWGADVLAPCSCTVVRIHINPEANLPGVLGRPPASSITFETSDNVMILFAHIANPLVRVGDVVTAGQIVAEVGNNGYSRQPHIHIAAWRGESPLQLRFDQTSMGPDTK